MFNTLARAVVRYNKQKELYRLVVAFNVYERNAKGEYKFPVQKKCDYVSGDIAYETLQEDLDRALENAKRHLRTDNIEFV